MSLPNTELLIGHSPKIAAVKELVRKVAGAHCNVLITGETGTGKELVARLIHDFSVRRNGPLVSFNCAAIPDGLVEAELFGHEKGAFTGAWQRTDGRIVEANHGTLFLDEIGEMSLYAQAKILRAIETHHIQRLGSKGNTFVDVRVITATNQNLDKLVGEGRFRQDLFFRLNVAKISVPPLRERRPDISLLACHFLECLGCVCTRCPEGFSEEVQQIFVNHSWPGNVRELKNVVEFSLIHLPWPNVEVGHLPEGLQQTSVALVGERESILHVLNATNWNKSAAAKRLHWSRMTLYRKMAKHAIPGVSDPSSMRCA